MTVFYLDTSAINRLLDSADKQELIRIIQAHTSIYPSIFNIAEIASDSNVSRRKDLLVLVKDISKNFRPLAMPGELLKRSIVAIGKRAKAMEHSMGKEWDGVWIALNNPDSIDKEAYNEIVEWKRKQDGWLEAKHVQARPLMQQALNRLPTHERNHFASKFSKMIKSYRLEFVHKLVFDLAKNSGLDIETDNSHVSSIIKHSEHWRFFLASMGYSIYSRSVKTSNFSKSKNPGSIDIMQAVYLAACDVFVTADKQQRRMLRFLVPFGHKKREIWNYNTFELYLRNV
jgi:hypothetical protein